MTMKEFSNSRLGQKIKCYHTKIRNENSYAFIIPGAFGVSIRNKGKESSITIGNEKYFMMPPKKKSVKEIKFQDGAKRIMTLFKKQKDPIFNMDTHEFTLLLMETMTREFAKIKPISSDSNSNPCQGG